MVFDPASIEAVRSLERELDLSTRDARSKAYDAVRTFAFKIERSAKQRAPVDTGALRNSINTTVSSMASGSASAEVGPEVRYGGWVELGTHRTAPQPYLGPAFDRHEPAFVKALESISPLTDR
jgi:HK97 gp10 family phage protein